MGAHTTHTLSHKRFLFISLPPSPSLPQFGIWSLAMASFPYAKDRERERGREGGWVGERGVGFPWEEERERASEATSEGV